MKHYKNEGRRKQSTTNVNTILLTRYDAKITLIFNITLRMVEFSVISELRTIREQKSTLTKREEELSKPLLYDYSVINTIYGMFKEAISTTSLSPNASSPLQRRKFIFIILLLYSPSTLAGGKMKAGLRDRIAESTGCSGTLISHNCEDIVFLYQQYKSYREDIDNIYAKIMEGLGERNLI